MTVLFRKRDPFPGGISWTNQNQSLQFLYQAASTATTAPLRSCLPPPSLLLSWGKKIYKKRKNTHSSVVVYLTTRIHEQKWSHLVLTVTCIWPRLTACTMDHYGSRKNLLVKWNDVVGMDAVSHWKQMTCVFDREVCNWFGREGGQYGYTVLVKNNNKESRWLLWRHPCYKTEGQTTPSNGSSSVYVFLFLAIHNVPRDCLFSL